MRKVVLGLAISLDGYIARSDGSVDFLFMPKDYSMAPFFATVDVAIMGRKTLDAGLKMGGGVLQRLRLGKLRLLAVPADRKTGRLYRNQADAGSLDPATPQAARQGHLADGRRRTGPGLSQSRPGR